MKRTLFPIIGAIAFALVLMTASPVLADNGPHGGYTAATDACASCHRAHTAVGPALLVQSTSYALCISCHGSSATGANTNVEDGLDKSVNRSLRAGGFVNVTMNPAEGESGSTVQVLPVTSSHMVTGGSNTVWGYGAINAVPDAGAAGISLTCTNCHNPHGRAGAGNTATYRILKGSNAGNEPLFGSQDSTVDLPDEAAKTYYTGANGDYFGDHGSSVGGTMINAAMTSWCAQCHTRYHAPYPGAPGSTDSGDAIFAFRHVTNDTSTTNCMSCHPGFVGYYPGCVSCHMAHGTGVRMGSNSGSIPWPDGNNAPGGNNRSSLLRIDNRGVCWQCHVDRGIAFP
ncbi:MAG: cytochrome c3 family protein [Chloroflexi bacterium]|nr:cytochrome c3 family protein [Chloroflexota bacterium]